MCFGEKVICNQCGKIIFRKKGILHEDCLSVHKRWGYFSTQDGVEVDFHLCEKCYKKLIQKFMIPVRTRIIKELL